MARDRRGLIRTTAGAAENIIFEGATTVTATAKAIRHGANSMEVAMKESVITAIEDLAMSKAAAVKNLVEAGYSKEEVQELMASYDC